MSDGVNVYHHMEVNDQLSFLHSILKNSIDYSIIALDLNCNVQVWNAGANHIYKYKTGEIIGKNINALHTLVDIESGKVQAIFNEVLEKGKWEGELRRVSKAGEELDIFSSISLRVNANGDPEGFLLISQGPSRTKQISSVLLKHMESEKLLETKNKELEAITRQAQEASRLKSEFIANVSHELRTPLNGIIGFAEMLYDGLVDPNSPKHKEFLGDILTSSRQLLLLINDVLDLAKVESGKMEFFPETIDFPEIMNDTRDIFKSLILKKNIQFEARIANDLCEIVIDAARFKQIIFNYVSNALKFTEKKGKVIVQVRAHGKGNFILEVIDTGIGIREKELRTLFVEFHQLDSGASKKYPGTGLGLALTKSIVEAQGGKVGVSSTFGEGSNFYAILPCKPKQIVPKQIKSEHKVPKKINILLIEDSAFDVHMIQEFLKEFEDFQFNLFVANDIAEGIKYFATERVDIIILDLYLPDGEGINAFHQVKKFAKDIPIIIMSGISDKDIFYQAMQEGAQNYLIKGKVDGDMLLRSIRSAIWSQTSERG